MRFLSVIAMLAAGTAAMAGDATKLGRYEPGTASVDDAGHKYRYGYGGYYGGYRGYYGGYNYYRPSLSFYYGGGGGYGYGYRPYFAPSYYYAPAPVFSYYYAPRWCGISNPTVGGVSLTIMLGDREPLASRGLPSPYVAPQPQVPQVAPTPEPPNLDVKISDPAVRKAMRYPAYGDK